MHKDAQNNIASIENIIKEYFLIQSFFIKYNLPISKKQNIAVK